MTMGFAAITIDNIKLNGATFDDFNDGNYDGWGTYIDGDGTIDINEGVCLLMADTSSESHALTAMYRSLGTVSPSDTISFDYTYAINATDGDGEINIIVRDEYYDYVHTIVYANLTSDEYYGETLVEESNTFADLGLEESAEIFIDIWVASEITGGPAPTASAVFQIDDIELFDSSYSGFANGDFELGTLANWTIIGSASIDTSVVHNGSYSCLLPANDDINGIKQRIDLTDTEQLNIFYNIPSNTGSAYFTIVDLGGDYVLCNRDQYTTPGWVCHTLDVSELTGEYVLFIYSYNCTLYVDDISTQESFSTSLQYGTFNYGTWFTPSAEQFSKYCKYPPTSGEDSSRCLNLNPVWNYSPYTSSAYSYCNLTEVNSISLKYRIPEFDKGYAGMGGAWLKIKLEGDTTETHTIATATVGGSIPDWTTYSVDTSHLTGIYKVTVFGQVTDAGYTLHPTLNAYIDNILANINISLITELCLYQYIDDDLITDIGHDVFETTDTGSRRISHRLTDIGHHLIFPVVTSRDDLASFIDKTINITTRMIMKLRRVKP